MKYNLPDELKEHFKVIKTQLCEPKNSITIQTEPQDTYDKAVVSIIAKLKKQGYKELKLPLRPPPIVVVIDENNYLPIITLVKEEATYRWANYITDILGKEWEMLKIPIWGEKEPNQYDIISRCPDTRSGIIGYEENKKQIRIEVSCEIIEDLIRLGLINKPKVEKDLKTSIS